MLSESRRVLETPTSELMRQARSIRDQSHGSRVTYSPKVFIPLTMLCRDKCGYCTFAQPPARLENPYLSTEQVLTIAKQGARVGCHEALFTLGERPELRYEVARDWLATNGFDSTVHYLHDMAALVLKETGLLPHANAGALYRDELEMLRPVSASQGMMIESLRGDLDCHRGAPDKEPQRRLDTLNFAGELKIPFTTGILVGIGETREDRILALEAIAESHAKYGHVQEVIVQNFLPKPLTGMQHSPACPQDEYLWSVAAARVILPPEIHLQAPPNLSDDFGQLLNAGIDDWGGVSPVTADHVNPERPWPALDKLRDATEQRGKVLAPRLTIYPEFATKPAEWLDGALYFAILDRSDAEGLGRDDPGQVWPEKVTAADVVQDGAEVILVGHRSTQWYSGANNPPPILIDTHEHSQSSTQKNRTVTGPVGEVLRGIELGQRVNEAEIVTLFSARGSEVSAVARVADALRKQVVGDVVTSSAVKPCRCISGTASFIARATSM